MTQPVNSIAISDLQFKWSEQDTWVLNIDSLTIKPGEKIFLYGPSGSGKTTFLDLLTGIHIPAKGSIELLGKPIQKLTAKQRDKFRSDHIGLIFQQFNLLPYLNVVENVTLPCHFSNLRRQKVEEHSSLAKRAMELLSNLGINNDLYERKAIALSVGQQQRVAVARALIGEPEIIMADEPTSALDEDARNDFIQQLFQQSANKNTTIIFVSHDKQLASHFDRTIAMESLLANNKETNNVL